MLEGPTFDDLPLRPDGPHGNAWGRFGDSDELGTLNLLNSETTRAAVQEVKHGIRVSCDWSLDAIAHPMFGRAPFEHCIKNKAPRSINDDILTFNTQISSQWDGFRHYGYQRERRYYNDRTLDDIMSTRVNGIDAWVDNGGIVGRGVLLDYAAWSERQGRKSNHFDSVSIPVAELEEVARSQGVELKRGDILLVRSGWMQAYKRLSDDDVVTLAERESAAAIGIESSETTLRWLWETGFSAVAGDMPSFEAWPCQDTRYWLHEWLLAGWGMPIGELFDLDQLSRECRKAGKWSFLFTSVPLKVPGGVASPPNAVAIL